MSNPFNPASFVHPLPTLNLASRRALARQIRRRAAQVSRREVVTSANEECIDFAGTWPTNFSKGLPHYPNGLVEPHAMQCFVNAINGPDGDFDVPLGPCAAKGAHRPDPAAYMEDPAAVEEFANPANPADKPEVRGWESPISGHVFDLEGPDAGSVGMAPAPKLGSDELAAEMAEVYAMAILRDVPFTDIGSGHADADNVISALNAMPLVSGGRPCHRCRRRRHQQVLGKAPGPRGSMARPHSRGRRSSGAPPRAHRRAPTSRSSCSRGTGTSRARRRLRMARSSSAPSASTSGWRPPRSAPTT